MATREQVLKAQEFHSLMPYRIKEVLLVSSPYDAFILEEDGLLTEQVFFEYQELRLPGPPRFTHVGTAEAAMELLKQQRFDLILTMTSVADTSVNAFGKRIKALRPNRPVVLLVLDRKELQELGEAVDPEAVDAIFLWSGSAEILLAIIKYIEDRDNVDHDVKQGDVRVIIMIEDSPRDYSAFLAMLYKELMRHSSSLYSQGVNELHRRMLMKSRPKIIHASTYEEGKLFFERYRRNVMAVISDVGIPRGGEIDPNGGLDFARFVRQTHGVIPILLQSADPSHATPARELSVVFVDKGSPRLLARVRRFLTQNLGFGDFIFRGGDGRELDRASDLVELEEKIATVPEESISYHVNRDHFSLWLMARSEFKLAKRLRPRKLSDFPSVEATRQYLLRVLGEARERTHRGVIADFRHHSLDHDPFSRLGTGSLGGKARGIAFLDRHLAGTGRGEFGGLAVRIPKTVVIGTDYFDRFMEDNDLFEFAHGGHDDEVIAQRFLRSPLSDDLCRHLPFIVRRFGGPIAVRSSSLLENNMHQPFAGIYTTLMIANDAADFETRLDEVARAVRLVYASTYYRNARSYFQSTGNRVEEEKMAILLQAVVGRRHGQRFYPTFSGVAQSRNYYPVGPQQVEDGVVHLALGLGRTVVDGGLALRFSPKHPRVLPQFSSVKEMLDQTQRGFYALDMACPCCDGAADLYKTVRHFDLHCAEEDGTLHEVGSVFNPDDARVRDDLTQPGVRMVTFNNFLQHEEIPLAPALERLLAIAEEGLGCPVDMEFAGEVGDRHASGRGDPGRVPELYPLQVRPMSQRNYTGADAVRVQFNPGDLVLCTDVSLGHGVEEGIHDLVYVRRDRWQAAHSKTIAVEIEGLNEGLKRQGRPYVLVGPGRWGSTEPWLGIPVQWSQISGVRVIVEASLAEDYVEPSQGRHFLHNLAALRIGYLTVSPPASAPSGRDSYLDWEWLEAQPSHQETEHLRHVRWSEPLAVVLDGGARRGLVAKPGARPRMAA